MLLGKPIKYVDVAEQQFFEANLGAGMPKWVVQNIVVLEKMKALGWTAAVSPDFENVLGRVPTALAAAIKLSSTKS